MALRAFGSPFQGAFQCQKPALHRLAAQPMPSELGRVGAMLGRGVAPGKAPAAPHSAAAAPRPAQARPQGRSFTQRLAPLLGFAGGVTATQRKAASTELLPAEKVKTLVKERFGYCRIPILSSL